MGFQPYVRQEYYFCILGILWAGKVRHSPGILPKGGSLGMFPFEPPYVLFYKEIMMNWNRVWERVISGVLIILVLSVIAAVFETCG